VHFAEQVIERVTERRSRCSYELVEVVVFLDEAVRDDALRGRLLPWIRVHFGTRFALDVKVWRDSGVTSFT